MGGSLPLYDTVHSSLMLFKQLFYSISQYASTFKPADTIALFCESIHILNT